MATRSKRMCGPTLIAALGPQTIGTVPDGKTWLVKTTRVVNVTAAARTFGMHIGDPPDGVLFLDSPIVAHGIVTDSSQWVAHAGEDITFEADAVDSLSVLVSGFEFNE